MNNPVYKRDSCRLCGSNDLVLAVHFPSTPIGDAFVIEEHLNQPQPTFPLDLLLCRECGNVQLVNVVNPELIYREYTYKSSVSLGLVEHFKKYADDVVGNIKPPDSSMIVEIGSNEGAMLFPFKQLGHRVLGIDPAREIAKRASENGIETLPTYFTTDLAKEIRQERGPASIVIANNVFANIDNVSDMIEGVRYLLADDGVFIFETSYWLDVFKNKLIDTIFHEHLNYFAVSPLVSFFKRLGMSFYHVECVHTKGGSIRGYVQLAEGQRPTSSTISNQIQLEKQAGLDSLETYQSYTEDLDELKKSLLSILTKYKNEGKTIAAYGAAVGLTTMIYDFGLGDFISYIVDDNSEKHNTFSPGLHLPTLPSDVLYERNPDVVVVLAWRYIDSIIKKHQPYLDRGGKFISILPKLEVI